MVLHACLHTCEVPLLPHAPAPGRHLHPHVHTASPSMHVPYILTTRPPPNPPPPTQVDETVAVGQVSSDGSLGGKFKLTLKAFSRKVARTLSFTQRTPSSGATPALAAAAAAAGPSGAAARAGSASVARAGSASVARAGSASAFSSASVTPRGEVEGGAGGAMVSPRMGGAGAGFSIAAANMAARAQA